MRGIKNWLEHSAMGVFYFYVPCCLATIVGELRRTLVRRVIPLSMIESVAPALRAKGFEVFHFMMNPERMDMFNLLNTNHSI